MLSSPLSHQNKQTGRTSAVVRWQWHQRTQKPILLVCIAPPPPGQCRAGTCRSLCRLRVLPVATRAAQLSPLNLNCSTPDSAAERTFSSPERALTPKPEGESCAHSRRVALRWPLRRPSRAGFSSGLTLLVPLTPLSPQVATQDCRGPDSCPGTATLSPSS